MKTLGVIIGRFQVPFLHSGHKELIYSTMQKHDHVLILVGEGTGLRTLYDPLPVSQRMTMVTSYLATAKDNNTTVRPIYNHPSDQAWSTRVDDQISLTAAFYELDPNATLYSGRGGFAPHYLGKHKVEVFTGLYGEEGRTIRDRIGAKNSEDFRSGMIFAQRIKPPISYQTLDVAVFDNCAVPTKILLGQKAIDGGKWRLPGGFMDPTDASLEAGAAREVMEELNNIGITTPVYIGSERINDYRYRNSADKICTALFACQYVFGSPEGSDDLAEAAWHPFDLTTLERIHPVHRPLIEKLLAHYGIR